MVRNFFFLSFNHIISQVLMFLSYAILAQRLTVEYFGKMGFAQAFINYFILLLNLGLPIYGIKKYVLCRTEQEKHDFFNQIFSIRSYLLVALIIPYIFITFLFSRDIVTRNLIFVMGITILTIPLNIEWYYQAVQKMQYIAYANIAKSLFFVLCIFFMVRNNSDIILAGFLYGVSFIILVIVLIYPLYFKRSIKLIKLGKWVNPIISESLILGLSFLLIQVYYSFSIFILGLTRAELEVGYYSSIHKLLMFFLMGVSLLLKSVFPHMSGLVTKFQELEKFVIKLTRWAVIFSFFITGILFFSANQLIPLVFSDKYISAVGPFRILIFIFFIIMSRTLIENSLIILNKAGKYLVAVLVGASSNIILNLIFTPLYGIYATVIIYLISEIILTVLVFYFSDIKFHKILFVRLY